MLFQVMTITLHYILTLFKFCLTAIFVPFLRLCCMITEASVECRGCVALEQIWLRKVLVDYDG